MRLIGIALALTACQAAPQQQQQTSTLSTLGQEPARFGYRVVATFPHDTRAFTEGLFFDNGQLWESTGLERQSDIRRVNLADGRVVQRVTVPDNRFGEGSIAWGNQIVSLTYRDGIGYRWDKRTLRQLGTFRYTGEGWGLTQNGTDIVMSDGTSELRFLDPQTMAERRRLRVTANGQPVDQLNELEWVNGELLANIWQTAMIARINPANGQVTGWIDLSGLVRENAREPGADVLNGIAYDAATRRLYVTGKNWPHMYQVELVPLTH